MQNAYAFYDNVRCVPGGTQPDVEECICILHIFAQNAHEATRKGLDFCAHVLTMHMHSDRMHMHSSYNAYAFCVLLGGSLHI